MRVGIAADHGGYDLKQHVVAHLKGAGHEIVDFGARALDPGDDYPDFVLPLARSLAAGEIERGIAVCGSGVGAAIAANKIPGVRAGLVHDTYSAHQGVEHDDMNVLCLGGRVVGEALAEDIVAAYMGARFSGEPRHRRRLAKIAAVEPRSPAGPD